MSDELKAAGALIEFFRVSQVLPRIQSDEKGFRHVEIRAYVKPLSPEESVIYGISVRDAKGLVPLEDLVREWQMRFKETEAHLDTSPGSLADEDLARWNEQHEALFTELTLAEQALAAFQLPEVCTDVERRELVARIDALDPQLMQEKLEQVRQEVLSSEPLAPAGALPSGEDD